MKSFVCVLVICLAASLFAQSPVTAINFSLVRKVGNQTWTGMATIHGKQITTEGTKFRCAGGCELKDGFVILQADELDYDQATGVASGRGSVSMQYVGVQPKQTVN